MYCIHRIVIVTWPISISCIASLPFMNSLLWPHVKAKCSSNAHFRITPEVVGHLDNCLLFYVFFCPLYSKEFWMQPWVLFRADMAVCKFGLAWIYQWFLHFHQNFHYDQWQNVHCSTSLLFTLCFHCVSYDGSIGEITGDHCVTVDMTLSGYSAALQPE